MKNLTRGNIWFLGAMLSSAATLIAMYALEGRELTLVMSLIGIVYVIFGTFVGQMVAGSEKNKNNF